MQTFVFTGLVDYNVNRNILRKDLRKAAMFFPVKTPMRSEASEFLRTQDLVRTSANFNAN